MKCYLNKRIWCERVFGKELANFHLDWIRLVENNDRVAIIAPTGFGKTELLAIMIPLWLVWFESKKEILILSKDIQQATKILERIKNEITDNELLKELIPEKQDTWTRTEINLSTKCKIFCKSYNQGEGLRSYHVDYVLCDEASSYEDTSIYFSYIVTRVIAKKGKLVAISTPVSIIDLMHQLVNNNEYASIICPCIQDGKPIWEARFPLEKLEQIKREIGIPAFEREYMVNPRAEVEDALYPPSMVMDCFDYTAKFRNVSSGGDIIIACDFAISQSATADFDAYVVIEKVGDICMLIHGERKKGVNIAAKVIRLRELCEIYKPKRLLVDKSNIGQAVIEDLRNAGVPVEGCDFTPASRNSMLVFLRKAIEGELVDGKRVPRLSIPRDKSCSLTITFTNILVDELIKFKEVKTKAKTVTYQSSGAHDDTVMALAMAIGGAQKFKKCLNIMAMG